VAPLTANPNTYWFANFFHQELTMSAQNGDKSRFNRERKRKIARRKRTHTMLQGAAKARKSANVQTRPVSA